MGLVISSFVRCLGVEVKRDEVDNKSLISHQGLSYCISIYPDNDCTSTPLVSPSTDSLPRLENADIDHGNLQVADNSSSLCLDQEAGTNYVEEIKGVIMSEREPTERANQVLGSEAEKTTKVDFIKGINVEGAMTSREMISQERWVGPYTSSQKMLLVGEGDFSFSASLACAFSSAANIIATSLDSHEYLSRNYSHAMLNISKLTERGGTVLHGVDCTKMDSLFSSMSFDRVIYNFPHAGFCGRNEPRDSQLNRHRTLVRLFLANAKRLVKKKGGEIHITHKSKGFFLEWHIKSLALDEGLLLLEEVPFNHFDYPGYHTMYGFGGNKFFYCYPSKAYKFGHPHCS